RTPAARTLLRRHWSGERGEDNFDAFWDDAIRRGFLLGSAAPKAPSELASGAVSRALAAAASGGHDDGTLEMSILPSPCVHDGRFADNVWLLELPRPVSKQTWGNAAMMSAATAARFGVVTGDVVNLAVGSAFVRIPVLVVPGHADDCVSVDLGYGRAGG